MPYYEANNTMTHVHHLIPKHMGGTNDRINLKELTVQDHADEHKWLFMEHAKVEDAAAWLLLQRAAITNDNVRMSAYRLAVLNEARGRKISQSKKGQKPSLKTIEAVRKAATGRNPSPETRAKIGAAGIGRKMTAGNREKLSERFKGKKLSVEHRAALSRNHKSKNPSVVVIRNEKGRFVKNVEGN